MRAPAPRTRADRGFTIIEVMVALSAGVLVSMSAFMLSKNATAFFQREARVSSAQLALNLAMNRLTGDIQRAALFSTANIMKDPTVCSTQSGTWPVGLKALTGINITVGTATTQGNGQNPPMAAPIRSSSAGAWTRARSSRCRASSPATAARRSW